MSELRIFDVEGADWRFGEDEDGTPWAVAVDVAKSFDQRDADKVTRLLEDDEKGTRIVGTPGGQQELKVIFEDGLWELIFLSRKPNARRLKKRVKAILKEIRKTGSYSAVPTPANPPLPPSFAAALRAYADEVEAHGETKVALAEAQPAADAWNVLADAKGDYSLREAAQILDRDPNISTGQNRLARFLQEIGWTDPTNQPYQAQVDAKRLRRRSTSFLNRATGEREPSWQLRITAKGVKDLRVLMLARTEPLALVAAEQLALA